jgi:putative FmdB family regulatory protein
LPTYEYECQSCHQRVEAVQSFTDPSLTICPHCGGELRKVFSAVGIVFKGSGFYKNDSRDAKSSPTKATSTSESSTTADSSSGTSDSSSAPAATATKTESAKTETSKTETSKSETAKPEPSKSGSGAQVSKD